MKKQWLVPAAFSLLVLPLQTFAKQDINIDMADGVSNLKYPLDVEQKVLVKIKNLAPAKLGNYQFSVAYKEKDIPTLDLPSGLDQQIEVYKSGVQLFGTPSQACQNLAASFNALIALKDERSVQTLIADLDSKLAALPTVDSCALVVNEKPEESVKKLKNSTTHEISLEIRKDLGAILTITDGKEPKVTKVLSVNTEGKSKWVTSFGFGFYDDRDENYYSKSNGSTDAPAFTIEQQQERSKGSYSALAMFTYPFTNSGEFDWGISAGIGANQSNIQAVIGVGMIIGKNVVATVGISGQEFTVLKGQYEVGQNIGAQPIDSANLIDKTFKASGILALTFRY